VSLSSPPLFYSKKLRPNRRGFESGRCPLCMGKEDDDDEHILVKCFETKTWREEFVCSVWLSINEDSI
jgi:hypothetical protein